MLGFPQTFQQAKQLEEALTGYVPEEERLNDTAEKMKKKVSELVSPTPVPPSNKLLRSGVDLIIHQDIDYDDILKRMSQRRVDPQTETVYHLEENPPPTDVKGLQERLQTIQEDEGKVKENYENSRMNIHYLQEWCEAFGLEEEKLMQLVSVKSQGKGFEVAKALDEYIDKVLLVKKHEFERLKE